jgi:hypothetical protein
VTQKAHPDFYTSDGRINPDKAFGFVTERVRTMSSEEFVTLMGKALEVRDEDGNVLTPPVQPDAPVMRGPKAKSSARKKPAPPLSPAQKNTSKPPSRKKKAEL